jgi:hypothetical protein
LKIPGYFFSNFFNIMMGIALLPILDQLVEPVHATFAAQKTYSYLKNYLKPNTPETHLALEKESADAWIHASGHSNLNILSVYGVMDPFCEEVLRRAKPFLADPATPLPPSVRNELRESLWWEAVRHHVLLLVMLIFVIKYAHEADRIEALLLQWNLVSAWTNLMFWLGRVVFLVSVVFMAKQNSSQISPWILGAVLIAFLIQDGGLRLARSKLTSLPTGLTPERVRTFINWWFWLDAWLFSNTVVLVILLYQLPSKPDEGAATAMPLFAWWMFLLAICVQVLLPYIFLHDFYFRDYSK